MTAILREIQSIDAWARTTILLSVFATAVLFAMPEGGRIFWDLLHWDEMTVFPVFLAGTLLLALPVAPSGGRRSVLAWIAERPGFIAIGVALLLCILSLTIYQGRPLNQDEYAPWFQAQLFAQGHLFATYSPAWMSRLFDPVYHDPFFILDWRQGTVASSYWPGQALLMAPFAYFGAPWAFNPAVTGATIYVLWLLARDLLPGTEARSWVVLFALASPAFLINGISFYSMPAHLLLSLAYSWLLLESAPLRIAAAGLVGSFALLLHNPVPHILYCLPWIGWVATRDQRGPRNILILAAAYAPLSIVLGFGWYSLRSLHSCSPACAMASTAAITDAVSATPDPTLVLALAKNVLVLPDMQLLQLRAGAAVKLWMSAVPGIFVLAWLGLKRTHLTPLRLFAISAALTFVGYCFIPFSQGHGWGYRYFHAAWGALPLLAAAAMFESPLTDARRTTLAMRVVAFSLIILVPAKLFVVERFISEHWNQMPPNCGSANEIVLKNGVGYLGIDVVQNQPNLENKPLVLLGRGLRADRKFIESVLPNARLISVSGYGNTFFAGPAEEFREAARAH